MTIFKFLNIRTHTSFNTVMVKVYVFLIIKLVTITSIKINTLIQDLYHIIIFRSVDQHQNKYLFLAQSTFTPQGLYFS